MLVHSSSTCSTDAFCSVFPLFSVASTNTHTRLNTHTHTWAVSAWVLVAVLLQLTKLDQILKKYRPVQPHTFVWGMFPDIFMINVNDRLYISQYVTSIKCAHHTFPHLSIYVQNKYLIFQCNIHFVTSVVGSKHWGWGQLLNHVQMQGTFKCVSTSHFCFIYIYSNI